MSNDKLADFIRGNRDAFDGEQPPAGLWNRIEDRLEPEDDGGRADGLETFVALHRDAFDDVSPPPRIEDNLFAVPQSVLTVSHRRRPLLRRWLSVAASLLLVMSATYFLGNRAGYRAGQEEQTADMLEQIDPELAEAEQYYRDEIATQFTRVKRVNNDPQLLHDLKEIDAATAEIRADLLTVPVSQRAVLVNQLIETYRLKLDILLRIQEYIPNGSLASPPQQSTDAI